MRKRTLLLGAVAAAGALVVGWGTRPPRQRLNTDLPLPPREGQVALNGWVRVGSDDRVHILMCKSEMGQGVHTGLAMALAEELDADWAQVHLQAAPLDAIYNNQATVIDGLPFHPDADGTLKAVAGWLTAKTMREVGVQMTGGSSSIKDLWLPMREAGAAARALLVAAAAAQWGVAPAEVRVAAGVLSHAAGHRARFGEVAAAAAKLPLPLAPPLKDPQSFKLLGQPLRRIEAAAKGDGTARFGIDVLPPGLHHARVLMCPTLGGSVASFDAAAAQGLPGVKKVLQIAPHGGGSGAVVVVADAPWRAAQALAQVKVQWNPGPAATLNSAEVMTRLAATLDTDEGFALYRHGDAAAALQGAAKTVRSEYRAPYLAHAALEPMNCTVLFEADRATVWASTQVPGLARAAAAQALGLSPAQVDVNVELLGGGFGRRLESDFVGQAAAIARELPGVPVQTVWSREQDMTHDFYRPACVSRWEAGFDAKGALLGVRNVSAGQAILPQVLKRTFGLPWMGPDKTANEGAFDQPYEWPAARIAHAMVDLPVPVGFWRSVGHSHQAFFKECFVDELAHAAGTDPVAFRAGLLKKHPRHAAVLQRAAQAAGWGTPLAPAADGAQRARGVALHHSFGSVVAQVAEVSLGADKTIRVHRVVCAIDCGFALNPNLVAQQMESAVIFGLSAALFGQIDIVGGQVQQTNFHNAPVLRINECPVIETHILPSSAPPEGVGEPGTPPIAPAVANALFALTGQRLRSLPLKVA